MIIYFVCWYTGIFHSSVRDVIHYFVRITHKMFIMFYSWSWVDICFNTTCLKSAFSAWNSYDPPPKLITFFFIVYKFHWCYCSSTRIILDKQFFYFDLLSTEYSDVVTFYRILYGGTYYWPTLFLHADEWLCSALKHSTTHQVCSRNY